MQNIDYLKKNFQSDLFLIQSNDGLEQLRIKYLGRNGLINQALRNIKNLLPTDKKELGEKANKLKNSIIRLIEKRQKELFIKTDRKDYFDATLPGKAYPKGSLHVMTLAIEEIRKIFEKIGFIQVSYPEVEWEHFAFESLNMPKNHPARDDFETFFIDTSPDKKYGKMILTPHTSSGQVREMLRTKPPIKMINIAKCYRPNWDLTHAPMFYQFEGLCIDRGINISHLKGTVDYFAKEFFEPKREIRLRPHHFQFTEPSFEIDVSCGTCLGTGYVNKTSEVGQTYAVNENVATEKPRRFKVRTSEVNKAKCRVCKSGWMELGGAGIVHPKVLKAGGINPDKYSGWAFGFGPERCFMMKTGLSDIRDLYGGNIRFLEQF